MRLQSLRVRNLRGIKELDLNLACESAVIWGPNGSGKSAVVDAIDFLLTGGIPRLSGPGTQGITLQQHGPHIDMTESASLATVSAVVQVPGIDGEITLNRSVGDPGELTIQGVSEEHLSGVLAIAQQKQHSLSRKELLDYIAAKKGRRSALIQALLGLTNLEDCRLAVRRVLGNSRRNKDAKSEAVESQKLRVTGLVGHEDYSDARLLGEINEARKLLSAPPIDKLVSSELKGGIKAIEISRGTPTVSIGVLKRTVDSILSRLVKSREEICARDRDVRTRIEAVMSDRGAVEAATKLDFLHQGNSLLDGSGRCPFCGRDWESADLASHVSEEIARAEKLAPELRKIEDGAAEVKSFLDKHMANLEQIAQVAGEAHAVECPKTLSASIDRVKRFSIACRSPLKEYVIAGFDAVDVKSMFEDQQLEQDLQAVIESSEKALPELSPQQIAWDTLTKLETALSGLESAAFALAEAEGYWKRASDLQESFEESKELVLNTLYDSISGRFCELYQYLHSEDESEFEAVLRHDGKFEVDFFGRGQHPPLALHSEGHQDSMGLCLYLALAEKLTSGTCMLTVLDDVVMSVDSGHRRQICRMLREFFPDRQFLITTHDKTWSRQLRIENVVGKRNSLEFYRWSIETGPSVLQEADIWSRIDHHLANNDIPTAAFHLRNGSEQFFEGTSDSLNGSVRYRSDGRYDLGDFMGASVGRLKELIRKGKVAASSWKNGEAESWLREFDSIVGQVIVRTNLEQWSVNSSVHYNQWCQLDAKDFLPVVEAFRDSFALFSCRTCSGTLQVTEKAGKAVSVTCPCHETGWTLEKAKD